MAQTLWKLEMPIRKMYLIGSAHCVTTCSDAPLAPATNAVAMYNKALPCSAVTWAHVSWRSTHRCTSQHSKDDTRTRQYMAMGMDMGMNMAINMAKNMVMGQLLHALRSGDQHCQGRVECQVQTWESSAGGETGRARYGFSESTRQVGASKCRRERV